MNELISQPRGKAGFIRTIPLFIFLLIAYNIGAFAFGHDFNAAQTTPLIQVKLISGALWGLGWNDLFLILGMVILFIEIVKSSRTTVRTTFEHALSMLVFVAFLVEFLVVQAAGSNVFFLLGIMTLIDVMAGYTVSIAVARKDLNISP